MRRSSLVLLSLALTAAAAPVAARGGHARVATCEDLPAAVQGFYRRGEDPAWMTSWSLALRGCAFVASENGIEQGSGDYTVDSGDSEGGTLVISNDQGCHDAADQDVPTPYGYTFDGSTLVLTPPASDLCVGRAHDLGRTWLKVPVGRVTITFALPATARAAGRFELTGAGSDTGRVTLARARGGASARGTITGGNGAITFVESGRGRLRRWRIVGGTKLYAGVTGSGTERVAVAGRRVHVAVAATLVAPAS